MRMVAGISGSWLVGVVEGHLWLLGFLWIFLGFFIWFLGFRNFLKIFRRIWRTLKNFAKLSRGWKEGMVWLQEVLENENGPSDFFVWIFLKIFSRFWIFVGFIWKLSDVGRCLQ